MPDTKITKHNLRSPILLYSVPSKFQAESLEGAAAKEQFPPKPGALQKDYEGFS